MLTKKTPYFQHEDERGKILGVLNSGNWKEVNYVSSEANIVRGQHYHKETLEKFFLIDGELKFIVQKVENGKLVGEVKNGLFKAGDIFLVEPFSMHVIYTITPCKWINILSKAFDPDSPDIHDDCGRLPL